MQPLLRFFSGGILFASIAAWIYFSYVTASKREAIVIEDRYDGLDEKAVIHPTQAAFLPLRILPGHVTLHHIELFPRSLQVYFKQDLEQSEMLGLDDSFYIRMFLHLNYVLDPKKIAYLFGRLHRRNWSELKFYLKFRIHNILERRLATLYKTDADLVNLKLRLQDYFSTQASVELNQQFQREGVRWHSIIPLHIFVPNPVRYRSMLASGQKIINQKIERIRNIDQARARKDAAQIENEAYFIRLKRIGELLTTYPHLRDYLAVDRLSDDVKVMVMPYQRWFSPAAILGPQAQKETNNSEEMEQNRLSPTFDFFPFSQNTSPTESGKQKNDLNNTIFGRFSDISPP